MKKSNLILTAVSTISALTLLSCGQSPTKVAGGVETGNGIVAGIVAASEGDPVVVTLVPEAFNPLVDSIHSANRDTTGVDSSYSVTVPAGTYNVIAVSLADENKIDFISKVVVVKDSKQSQPIELEQAQKYSISLKSAQNDGKYWIKGSTFVASYSAGDTVAVFAGLPTDEVLPSLYKRENNTDTLISADFVVGDSTLAGQATLMKGDDGFPNYKALSYDSIHNELWAGTAVSGVFRYNSEKPVTYVQDDTSEVKEFKTGIRQIASAGSKVYVTTANAVLKYARLDSNPYTVVSSGAGMLGTAFVQDSAPIFVSESKISDGVWETSIPGIRSFSSNNDTIYTGTVDGKIYSVISRSVNSFSVGEIGSVNHLLATKTTGSLFAAGLKGLAAVKNQLVVKTWPQFSVDSAKAVVALSQNSTGTVFILTKSSQLYKIDNKLILKEIIGFKDLIPLDQQNKPFPVIDIETDELNRIWLLTENGALIRIEM